MLTHSFLPSLAFFSSLFLAQLVPGLSFVVLQFHSQNMRTATWLYSSAASSSIGMQSQDMHPAVADWPQRYGKDLVGGTFHSGPRILHSAFTVEKATTETLKLLDVLEWPVWTTADKERWAVGKQVTDKEMPYGELSYMVSGRLEIIPKSSGQAFVVNPGDFVTFPKGFVASWKVLDEVTWHYYLY